jgi:hypothetical protein
MSLPAMVSKPTVLVDPRTYDSRLLTLDAFAPISAIGYLYYRIDVCTLPSKGWCMGKKKNRSAPEAASFSQARDELFSHILRCGVIDALPEHQKDWFDDTMGYIADRYDDLSEQQLAQLRTLGERYCQPVRRVEPMASGVV